ncbi:Ig-like domain-containing protein, partial [Bernardetia sp.]|uniref:Ig-like domain-containing protein n=1 Tax=Bernardetia sp. TaxID=1937974 RepID=UPI0025B9395E
SGGTPFAEPYDFIVVDYDRDWDDDIIDPLKGGDDDAAIFQNTNSPPDLSSSTPADGATDFPENADLVLNFNETVTLGTGNIEIRRVSDNVAIETINIASTTLSGGTQLTINPASNLPTGIDLYVHINAGAVIDTDNEITVSLRNQPTTLNFQAIPVSSSISTPTIFHLEPISRGAFTTDLLGGNETSIVTYTGSSSSFAADIEVDETNGHIYILDRNADELRRYNLDGTNNTLIYTYSFTPQDIALDLTNNLIYHTETQTGPSEVFTTDLNGGSKNTIIAYTAVSNVLAYLKIELDVANNHMYLLNSPGDELVRFDTDGTNPQSITSYTTQQDAFALDLTNSLIYHIDRTSGGEAFTTNLLGGARTSLFTYTASGSSLYKQIELDVANNHMYLLNTNGDVLTRFNTDGTNPTTIFSYASGDNVQDIFLAGLGTPPPSVLLSSNPILDFDQPNNTNLGATISDGLYGTPNISDADIQMYEANSSGVATGNDLGYFDNPLNGGVVNLAGSGSDMIVIEESSGNEFYFRGVELTEYAGGGYNIKIEGFRNTVSTGSQVVVVGGDFIENFNTSTLTASIFQNVDRIEITNNDGGNLFLYFDKVVVGSPVSCSSPTGAATNFMAGNNPTSTTLDI